jgi:hypothetical protein
VNDDSSDNKLRTEIGRFPAVDEDKEPIHLLVTDYPQYLQPRETGSCEWGFGPLVRFPSAAATRGGVQRGMVHQWAR